MRRKVDSQGALNFQSERLAITKNHFARYASISRILDDHPAIVGAVHEDLRKTVKHTGPGRAAGVMCGHAGSPLE